MSSASEGPVVPAPAPAPAPAPGADAAVAAADDDDDDVEWEHEDDEEDEEEEEEEEEEMKGAAIAANEAANALTLSPPNLFALLSRSFASRITLSSLAFVMVCLWSLPTFSTFSRPVRAQKTERNRVE